MFQYDHNLMTEINKGINRIHAHTQTTGFHTLSVYVYRPIPRIPRSDAEAGTIWLQCEKLNHTAVPSPYKTNINILI